MFMFYKYVLKITATKQIVVPIDIGISTQSKEVYLGKVEVFDFLVQDQIGVCHNLIYMSKMCSKAVMSGVSALFGFLGPSGISPLVKLQKRGMKKVKDHRKERSQYIVNVFKSNASKGKIFLSPYNAGLHWILCAVDPFNNIIYYFDSLHKEEESGTTKGISEDLREKFNIALFQFRSEMEIATKLKMDTKWYSIKCPRQTNGVDCGYYVMRYMKEIISHRRIKIHESYFMDFMDCQFASYDQTQIDEVRIEWVRHVCQHM